MFALRPRDESDGGTATARAAVTEGKRMNQILALLILLSQPLKLELELEYLNRPPENSAFSRRRQRFSPPRLSPPRLGPPRLGQAGA